jgi:hypothetical protein
MKKILTSLTAAAVMVAAAVTVVAIGGSAAEAVEPPAPPAPRWQMEEADGMQFGFHRGFQNGMRAGFMVAEFWENDGVLDLDEIAQLPDWHPLKSDDALVAELLEDGFLDEADHEQLRAQHQEQYAEHAALRAERRAAAQSRWEARAEYRAQNQAACELGEDCDHEPLGPGSFGRGWGRQGPNV